MYKGVYVQISGCEGKEGEVTLSLYWAVKIRRHAFLFSTLDKGEWLGLRLGLFVSGKRAPVAFWAQG
jgi:hypothetical protein